MTHLVLTCVLWALVGGGSIMVLFSAPKVMAALEPRLPRLTFAERVARELQNPDETLREALREVDHIGYNAPAVAVAEPVAPTMISGGAVRVAPHPAANAEWAIAAEQQRALANSPAQQGQIAQAFALSAYAQSLRGCEPVAIGAWLRDQQNPPPRSVVESRPWYFPYVEVVLSSGVVILHEGFGGGRVTTEWLELHRNDIVPALRRLNGKDVA